MDKEDVVLSVISLAILAGVIASMYYKVYFVLKFLGAVGCVASFYCILSVLDTALNKSDTDIPKVVPFVLILLTVACIYCTRFLG